MYLTRELWLDKNFLLRFWKPARDSVEINLILRVVNSSRSKPATTFPQDYHRNLFPSRKSRWLIFIMIFSRFTDFSDLAREKTVKGNLQGKYKLFLPRPDVDQEIRDYFRRHYKSKTLFRALLRAERSRFDIRVGSFYN